MGRRRRTETVRERMDAWESVSGEQGDVMGGVRREDVLR